MAMFRCGSSGAVGNVGFVLNVRTATIGSGTNIFRSLVDLSSNSGSNELMVYNQATAHITAGECYSYCSGSGATWETYINTVSPCDIYKNGTKIGTTTPNTDFAIGLNIVTAGQSAVVVAVPV